MRQSEKTSLLDIILYSTGEGANSLVMNGIAGFAMLYYTEALGLDYKLAGLALSVSLLWDAITDPLMGHISDNTRCRYGRRHPYLLLGGLAMVLCFYFFWAVPDVFKSKHLLFWYLIAINLILRTAITVFFVPYGALGFELCTDYNGRSRLQGVRYACNMAANLLGPAMAWMLFFRDQEGVESTSVAENFVHMGTAFSIAALVIIFIVVFSTRKHITDTRSSMEITGNNIRSFLKDFKGIFWDPNPRSVFVFTTIVMIGIVLVSSLQMYVYVYFMKFTDVQKSIVHGSTMIGFGLGSLVSSIVARKFDKKAGICVGVCLGVMCNIFLLVIFVSGWMEPSVHYVIPDGIGIVSGINVPVSMLLFMLFHAGYWAGNGMMFPVAVSMIADVSEVNKYKTGILKDGSYSAIYSFIQKLSGSLGMFFSGYCLDWAGFVSGSDSQTSQAIRNVSWIAFLGGAVIAIAAMITILKYPITRAYMEAIKAKMTVTQGQDDVNVTS